MAEDKILNATGKNFEVSAGEKSSGKKKVLLLGDSIRLQGYGSLVKEMLEKECEVFAPEDNCRFAQYLLRMLFDYSYMTDNCDLVYFNAGLWDVCDLFGDGTFTPISVYLDNMERIADILIKRCKKVVFATTTPVTEDNPYNRNSEIVEFNEKVSALLKKKGVIIDDLFAIVNADIPNNICEDMIHLTKPAAKLCADHIAKLIKENLGLK